MAEALNFNSIEMLARAIFAHLNPMTGTRATGTATVTAPAGPDVVLPKNTYLLPIKSGEAADHLLYKVAPNPLGDSGSWLVTGGGSLSVSVLSNAGGGDQNLPAGSRFRFDPPFPGLDQDVVLDAAITNGTNVCSSLFGSYAGQPSLLKRMVFWQELHSQGAATDFFKAAGGAFPALLMVWTRSVAFQGRTTGGQQGVTRAGRGQRIFREGFECYVGAGSLQGAAVRRNQAMSAMQAATRLLSDSQINVDGESLSSVAGIEITSRAFTVAEAQHYIYQFGFEANATYERVERRTFGPWDVNHITATLPGRTSPEPTTPIELVNTEDPMP